MQVFEIQPFFRQGILAFVECFLRCKYQRYRCRLVGNRQGLNPLALLLPANRRPNFGADVTDNFAVDPQRSDMGLFSHRSKIQAARMSKASYDIVWPLWSSIVPDSQ